jgi:multicomponent Na+:H+ antiporter subunit F
MIGGDLSTRILLWVAVAFVVISAVVLYRAYHGPTIQDRLLAVNVAGTNTVVIIVLVAVAFGLPDMLDIAIVYALLNFVLSIAVARFIGWEWI